jgi:hypothetical protein
MVDSYWFYEIWSCRCGVDEDSGLLGCGAVSFVIVEVSKRTSAFITLFDLQLDAQNSYLLTYNTFIKILYMFQALPCSSSGGLRCNCIYVACGISSLSAGDCPVHRLRKNCSFLTGAQYSHLQTVTIYHRLHIYNYDVDLLRMSRVMLETCRGF